MLIEENEAKRILEPYVDLFRDAMLDSWQTYLQVPALVRAKLGRRSQADMLHDFQVHNFLEIEELSPGVTSHELRGLYIFVVEGRLAIRLKKFDLDRLSCKSQTSQVADFRNQKQLIMEFPAISNLELGYTLEEIGGIDELFFTCPSGKRKNYWEWGINGDLDNTTVDLWSGGNDPDGDIDSDNNSKRYSDEYEGQNNEDGDRGEDSD